MGRGRLGRSGDNLSQAAEVACRRSQTGPDARLLPTDEIVLIGQMFGTLGLRNEGPFGANYDALKFSLSAGYRVTETRTLLLVVAQDVLGRNFDLGTEFGFTIWNTF